MKRSVIAVFFLLLAGPAFAGGTLSYVQFHSQTLQSEKTMGVYVPEGYDPQGQTRYPVIYFLHGLFQNHATNWGVMKPVLDQMIADGDIQPVIVVSPNGSAGVFGGSMWTNSSLYGPYEDYVVQDVVGYVDLHYRTLAFALKRSLMGFSMGAMGTMTIGLTHPGVFHALAGHSGYYNWDRVREELRTEVLEENSPPPYDYDPDAGLYTVALFMVGGGYTPNPAAPFGVDFPLDAGGGVIESVLDVWKLHNPGTIAAQIPPGSAPAVYFDVGDQDEFFEPPTNVDLDQELANLGIDHEYHLYAGHHQLYPGRLAVSLAFLDASMNDPSAVAETSRASRATARIYQSVPNPAHGRTSIRFWVPTSGRATLKVMDARGRSMGTVAAGSMAAGDHSVPWNASDLPAGVYFFELNAGGSRETSKVTIVH